MVSIIFRGGSNKSAIVESMDSLWMSQHVILKQIYRKQFQYLTITANLRIHQISSIDCISRILKRTSYFLCELPTYKQILHSTEITICEEKQRRRRRIKFQSTYILVIRITMNILYSVHSICLINRI